MKPKRDSINATRRRNWSPPKLERIGTVAEIVQGGGGKISINPADPGEARKPKPLNPEA